MVGAAAAVLLAVTTVLASQPEPAAWEITVFEAVNGLPDWLHVVIWPFMQYGVLVAIPIAAGVAWWTRRHRLAVLLGTSGVAVYLLAKVVKRVAGRGRPDVFLETVVEREDFGSGSLGFTSGHAAVAATIATLCVLHLPPPWRRISVALVAVVFVGRMYVGAHLPLDMVGGIAMGVAAGIGATLLGDAVARRLVKAGRTR